MAEITAQAYQDLRDYITANWKYIELRDEEGAPVIRLGVGDDPRVTWTHEAGAQTLELTVTIRGTDSDITLPITFASSAIYKVASGGEAYSVESFSAFTMEGEGDELTVKHQIQVPQVI